MSSGNIYIKLLPKCLHDPRFCPKQSPNARETNRNEPSIIMACSQTSSVPSLRPAKDKGATDTEIKSIQLTDLSATITDQAVSLVNGMVLNVSSWLQIRMPLAT
jgi:hypothetical protein